MQKRKNKIKFLFLFSLLLILPIFLLKEYRIILAKKNTSIHLAQAFNEIEIESQKKQSFVFFVLTCDAAATIEKNFQTIMAQRYKTFRVVYIDQGSTDHTVALLESLIGQEGGEVEVVLKRYQKDKTLFESYCSAVQTCKDDEIIVHLSGNDWLAHPEVLAVLNQAYTNPDVWLTYGQYLDAENHLKGKGGPYPQKTLYKKRVQKAPWDGAYFKTFYAGLYKKAMSQEMSSLVFSLSSPAQEAFLKPISEMGKSHVQFIPQVLYIHSQTSQQKEGGLKLTLSPGKVREALLAATAFQKTTSSQQKEMTDMIIFSHDRPQYLNICLESIEKNLKGVQHLYAICTGSETYLSYYRELEKKFSMVSFVYPMLQSQSHFKESVLHSLIGDKSSPSYIILSTDLVKISSPISLAPCIEAMRKARAYGFYLHLAGKKPFYHSDMDKGIYSWVIGEGKEGWKVPNTLQMSLHRKIDLEREFKEMDFSSIEELKSAWKISNRFYRIGLSFEDSKIQVINGFGAP